MAFNKHESAQQIQDRIREEIKSENLKRLQIVRVTRVNVVPDKHSEEATLR